MSGLMLEHLPRHASRPMEAAVREVSVDSIGTAEWDRLSARALEENPFLSRQFVRAGMEAFIADRSVRMLAFRNGERGRLVGLLPFRRRRFGHLLALPHARGALNLYQVCGVPLLDRDHAGAVLAGFFAEAAQRRIPARWLFGHVDLTGDFAGLCERLAPARGMDVLHARAYDRPRLVRDPGGFEAHLAEVIGKKRVKEIQRSLRRLREIGEVRLERTREPAAVAARVEDFLAMEQAGWKGEQRTAFLSDPDHARFARLAFAGSPDSRGLATIDSLLLDGRPIAISINIGTGTVLYTPKCAFDEAYRKYGPGLILEYLVIDAFYGDGTITEMDAATTCDGHLISGLWNASRPTGTLVVGPRGRRTRLLARMEEAEHGARRAAKRMLGRAGSVSRG